MSDIFDNIKRLKAFEKIFMGISNNKFVFKDLDKPDEHQTIVFRNNGILDAHRTIEGSEKQYESLGKFDLAKLAAEIISNPKVLEDAFLELINNIKEVTFEEPEYAHLTVANIKTKDELLSTIRKEKRNYVIPLESLEEFNMSNALIQWKDAKYKIKENALVFNNDCPIGYLFKKEEKFFFLKIDVLENSSVSKLISKMTTPEKMPDNDNKES